MHKSHLITGLWLVAVQSLKVQPVTETVKSTSTPIASGGSSATLIPFNVDVVGPPDHRMDESIGNFYTSVWESKVSVHETSDSIQSFVSLKWPDGQGPGAAPISANKTWNACVLAMPDLREIVGAPGPGDGSCYDLVYPACLESMASLVSRTFLAYLGSSKPITPESVAYACKSVVDITMLPPLCVKSPPPPKPHDSDDSDDSDQLTTIKGNHYKPKLNPISVAISVTSFSRFKDTILTVPPSLPIHQLYKRPAIPYWCRRLQIRQRQQG